MKNANEDAYSCQHFQELLSDFMDEELSEKGRTAFLKHVASCMECSAILNDSRTIRRNMQMLPKVELSREFDFRLRTSILREQQFMNKPLYRFQLFLKENLRYVMAVPATAVIALIVMMTVTEFNPQKNMIQEMAQGTSVLVDEPQDEIIRYVLDSVDRVEAKDGIFLNEHNVLRQVSTTDEHISLVSF